MTAQEPPRQALYPPYVVTTEARMRWDLCVAIAEELFGGAGGTSADVWMASRSLYRSGTPTRSVERGG